MASETCSETVGRRDLEQPRLNWAGRRVKRDGPGARTKTRRQPRRGGERRTQIDPANPSRPPGPGTTLAGALHMGAALHCHKIRGSLRPALRLFAHLGPTRRVHLIGELQNACPPKNIQMEFQNRGRSSQPTPSTASA